MMIQEVVFPNYTLEEEAFMSGWSAASKQVGDMWLKVMAERKQWWDDYGSYVEYDDCMSALLAWQEQNEEFKKPQNIDGIISEFSNDN